LLLVWNANVVVPIAEVRRKMMPIMANANVILNLLFSGRHPILICGDCFLAYVVKMIVHLAELSTLFLAIIIILPP
jgi:hypothetical protein